MHGSRTRKPFPARRRRGTPRSEHSPRLKPEAEPVLNGVLARIGKPEETPFRPDAFQLEALAAVRRGDCLVMAPTGSGKTWIAEQAILDVLRDGKRCWYASPLKALSNAKWVEFGDRFESMNVGILTGDTKENTDAPVIVGTTEILRNQLYDAMHEGRDLPFDLVILDEAHYLGDEERGVVWEEIMIYLPVRVTLLLLSATIENGREIAAWLEGLRRKPCTVIEERRRPVPLYPLFLHPSGRLMPFLDKRRLFGRVEQFARQRGRPNKGGRGIPPYGEIVRALRHFDLLPAIFFLQSRAECDSALKSCRASTEPTEPGFEEALRELIDRTPRLAQHKQLDQLRHARVASHHGGQLPPWKFLVETLMKQGRLDAIFATSTVAAGVNFPARTIVLFNSDIFNGHECVPLDATAFHQMTGRAGRRGQDNIGFMLLVPARFMDLNHIRRLVFTRSEDIVSRIRNDFSMVLNLLLSQTLENVRHIFENSLAAFQQDKGRGEGRKSAASRLWRAFQRHLNFLKAEGFVGEDDRLTADGIWASQLRLDHPVLIAECLRRGALPRDDAALLAAVIAPFVYDRGQEISVKRKELPRRLVAAYDRVIDTVFPMMERLDAEGFGLNPLPLWTAAVIYDWARGRDWDRIIGRYGFADGDMAMLVSRTADNLRQIAALRGTHPDVAELAWTARESLLREPVVF
ncbi:MAG TPA: DEAD/DEAH box helicase [Syntrophales bacterium]|nr:DEAD/DEAH box helicase [Syntrophales bacterium]